LIASTTDPSIVSSVVCQPWPASVIAFSPISWYSSLLFREKGDGLGVRDRFGRPGVDRAADRLELRGRDFVFECLRRAGQMLDRLVEAEYAGDRPSELPAGERGADDQAAARERAQLPDGFASTPAPISARPRVPALMLRPTELSTPSNCCSAPCRFCVKVAACCAWPPKSFVAFASCRRPPASPRARA
jgi:hypothetical protein